MIMTQPKIMTKETRKSDDLAKRRTFQAANILVGVSWNGIVCGFQRVPIKRLKTEQENRA